MTTAVQTTDSEIVSSILAGDGAAVEELLVDRAGRTLSYLESRFGCEDLVAKVYLHLWEDDWRRLRTWRGRGSLNGWLRQVAARICLAEVKDRGRKRPLEDAGAVRRGSAAPTVSVSTEDPAFPSADAHSLTGAGLSQSSASARGARKVVASATEVARGLLSALVLAPFLAWLVRRRWQPWQLVAAWAVGTAAFLPLRAVGFDMLMPDVGIWAESSMPSIPAIVQLGLGRGLFLAGLVEAARRGGIHPRSLALGGAAGDGAATVIAFLPSFPGLVDLLSSVVLGAVSGALICIGLRLHLARSNTT